jgi:aspartyl-tRNA(Asn)/glutamyl-tRNA(Gln) amidotransferase subunit B
MEEGSLRCDANISIRLKGATALGTKVEVKNLNSIRNIKKAIEFEVQRMIEIVENGGIITQQTRSFDASNDTTFAIREKEDAHDYRYFADPDLAPFHLTESFIDDIRKSLPALPLQLIEQFQQSFGLTVYDANNLCTDKATADYFLEVIKYSTHYKAIANWMLGPIKQQLNESAKDFSTLQLLPQTLAELITIVEGGKVNFSVASSKILPELMNGKINPLAIAEAMNLLQTSDTKELEIWIDAALEGMPDKIAEYKKGKKGLIGLFVGEVKKISNGKADPKMVTALLQEKLK